MEPRPDRDRAGAALAAAGRVFALAFAALAILGASGCGGRAKLGKQAAQEAEDDNPPASITGPLVAAPPRKPFIKGLEIGCFGREVASTLGVPKLSIGAFHSDALYDKYRTAVRDVYGADMPDMNYFSIGHPNWQRRIPDLRHWLLRAGKYGAPTLALEPLGPMTYGIFADSPSLRKLRGVFQELMGKGIDVYIRFASEANLFGSRFSVAKSDAMLQAYRAAARWWKGYMPANAKLVFSPLINTPYEAHLENSPHGVSILSEMYQKGVYARIGGTLYSTTYNVKSMYDWYVGYMRTLDPDTPLQIDELGGPLSHEAELVDFIDSAANGRWPGLERINLFAGQVNARAQGDYGQFGFVEKGTSVSYIRKIFFSGR